MISWEYSLLALKKWQRFFCFATRPTVESSSAMWIQDVSSCEFFFLWRNFRCGNTNLHNCHNFQMSVSYDEHQFENTFHNWITILSSTLVNFSSPVFGCMRMALCMLNFIKLSIFQRLSRKHTSIRVYLAECLYTVVIQMWSKSAFDLYAIVSFNDALCHTIFVCWAKMESVLKWRLSILQICRHFACSGFSHEFFSTKRCFYHFKWVNIAWSLCFHFGFFSLFIIWNWLKSDLCILLLAKRINCVKLQ